MGTSALRRFAHPLACSINTSYEARYGKTVSLLELALQCLESSKYKAAYKFIAGSLPMLTVMLSSLSLDEYIPSTTRVFIKLGCSKYRLLVRGLEARQNPSRCDVM